MALWKLKKAVKKASPKPIDVFGGKPKKGTEASKWRTTTVTSIRDGREITWTLLSQRDGGRGVFGLLDITKDYKEDGTRYSVAYYKDSTPTEVHKHYKSLDDESVDFIDIPRGYYFDVVGETKMGIFEECMREFKRKCRLHV